MARQKRTRQPKTKFEKKSKCSICLNEMGLVETHAGLRYACTYNPSHTPLSRVR